MDTLLKMTGIGKLISFYRYIYFNGPGVVRWSGSGLILMIGLTHMYKFPENFEAPKYIGLVFRGPVRRHAPDDLGHPAGTEVGMDARCRDLWRSVRGLHSKPHVGPARLRTRHSPLGRACRDRLSGVRGHVHLSLPVDTHQDKRSHPRDTRLARLATCEEREESA